MRDFQGTLACPFPTEETVSGAGETVRMTLRLARLVSVGFASQRMACAYPKFGQHVSRRVAVRNEIALALASGGSASVREMYPMLMRAW